MKMPAMFATPIRFRSITVTLREMGDVVWSGS
jgi:hypothetical protein